MALLFSLGDARDVVVIVYGVIGIVFFAVATGVTIGLYFTVKGLASMARELVDESVKPTVASIRDAAETVRGTTDFVGRTAVVPIVRTYSAFAGVRRGLGVLAGLSRRGRSSS